LKIAIASGKGGTGKTTVAVNLAKILEGPVRLLDCDAEEPNCHIFLKPVIEHRESVSIRIPCVDESRCDACGECGRFCEFKAIVSLKTEPLVFPELCHGCGGCARICPQGAIREVEREIGVLETGRSGGIELIQGRLNVGEPMAPPLIRAAKRRAGNGGTILLDAPPGTSCPVIATLRDADRVVLVTEPTPFGLYDLTLAVETVRQLGIPFGVVINRADGGDGRVRDYCKAEKIEVFLEIPDRRSVAEAYSVGLPIVECLPEMRPYFRELATRLNLPMGEPGRG